MRSNGSVNRARDSYSGGTKFEPGFYIIEKNILQILNSPKKEVKFTW